MEANTILYRGHMKRKHASRHHTQGCPQEAPPCSTMVRRVHCVLPSSFNAMGGSACHDANACVRVVDMVVCGHRKNRKAPPFREGLFAIVTKYAAIRGCCPDTNDRSVRHFSLLSMFLPRRGKSIANASLGQSTDLRLAKFHTQAGPRRMPMRPNRQATQS